MASISKPSEASPSEAKQPDPFARIEQVRKAHIETVDRCLRESAEAIAAVGQELAACFARGNKVLICGNGGSACDAMHFAGECVGRFVHDRKALPAIALTADPGIITAIGNDYGFDEIFARQVRAHAQKGDYLITISTSGKSPNVLRALDAAREAGIQTLLLTGAKGAGVTQAARVIAVPSEVTAHIQETHITILQLLIALIEDNLF